MGKYSLKTTINPTKFESIQNLKLKYSYKNKKKEVDLQLLLMKNRKPKKIHQSTTHFPQIFNMFPKNLPNTGALTFVKGTNFQHVIKMKKKIFCVLNDNKTLAEIINDNKIKCLITEIGIADGTKNEFELSFLLDDIPILTKNKFIVTFYGIFYIFPSNGPMNHAVNVIYKR